MPKPPASRLQPLFVFFGGKGGVGKTTCAAAHAIREAASSRVLVISTDPAHSLGDALGVKLSARPGRVRVPGARGSLHAVELNAPRAFARWLDEHRQALGDIIDHGTWLDRPDANALLDLPIPGVDELVGLLEITRLGEPCAAVKNSGRYDRIVIDTAPTGHTLRLLSAPQTVEAVAGVFDDLQSEHRLIREQFGHGAHARPEAADRLIALLVEQARGTAELLRNSKRTAFHWVTLPEVLSFEETKDALAALATARLPVADVIVNRVIPAGPPCALCDRRRRDEGRVIARTRRLAGVRRPVRVVPAQVDEPSGVAALKALGIHIDGAAHLQTPRPRTRTIAVTLPPRSNSGPNALLDACGHARVIFFGGKGGVGKTTVAAAAAVRLARADPASRVLLLSTDPAHSLADVFGEPAGDRPVRVRRAPPNLFVRELDAPAELARRRADLEAAVDEIARALGSAAVGRSSRELIDLAPPGIDELLGMLSVMAEAESRRSRIVVDTAPTGHTLRLLEMPVVVRDWVQVLLQFLLKYRSVVRPGQLASELVSLSRSIRALDAMLHDSDTARFIVVARAAEVPRAETVRLLTQLKRLRIAVPAIVVNALTPKPRAGERCPRCRAVAAAEQRELVALKTKAAVKTKKVRCVIIQTPLIAPPPRGSTALDRWAGTWTA